MMRKTKTIRNLAFLGLVLAFAMRSSVGIRADLYYECVGDWSAHYFSPLCLDQQGMDWYCDLACYDCTGYQMNEASTCDPPCFGNGWTCYCGS
jgi:hypothetical protein